MRSALLLCALVGVRSLAVLHSASVAKRRPGGARAKAPRLCAAAPAHHPLHEEAAAGDANAVELLLFAGLAADARNDLGSTPLHMAVVNGHEGVAQLLLDHGAPADAPNHDGNSPLHAAVGRGQLACAQLLLARGADPNPTSNSGMVPLRVAAQRGDVAALEALLEAGAEMDEAAANEAFLAALQLCETKPDGVPLAASVPSLLHHVLDADMRLLQTRGELRQNVTCRTAHGALPTPCTFHEAHC